MIRLQVLLDRAHFSPGVIDGKDGGNLKLAEEAYRKANDAGGTDTAALTDKLAAADAEPTVEHYTITETDVAGPFVEHLPTDMAELAKLDSPAYANPVEELAERFHMDDALLKALNPGADFTKAGTVITVASVTAEKLGGVVTRIEVDKSANSVRAMGAGGKLLAVYPATVGSTERPAPSGTWKVRTVAMKATYTFDPKRLTFGKKAEGKLTIKPGPNNPVGTTWIDLTKDTYGIHGTPDPRLVGKRASHGCVRLTNWDIQQLAKSVKAGAVVVFKGTETRAKT
ncbi:L,D-transpeptidase [Polymorphobacter sp. PAMC 29334]|nr:L,D-transpeptidase [Polymorphobacter sp. PAMC 29334]